MRVWLFGFNLARMVIGNFIIFYCRNSGTFKHLLTVGDKTKQSCRALLNAISTLSGYNLLL